MRIKVKKNKKPILNPEDFKEEGYTSIRNPGAAIYKREVILLVTVRHKNGVSKLHVARSKDTENFTLEKEPFIDNNENSALGVEDARITKINKEYLMTFTAFRAHINNSNITRISLAKTKDFKDYYDRSIILEEFDNNKNGVILKNKKTYLFHRPFNSESFPSKTPSMYLLETKDFQKFKNLGKFMSPRKGMWDNARVAANTPAIKIRHKKYGECYFMLYHGANKKRTYRIGYLLLDKKNPMKILERSKKPLISPEFKWEKNGEVNNVIFGCGWIPLGKTRMRFYYSGADRYTSYADIILKDAEIIK